MLRGLRLRQLLCWLLLNLWWLARLLGILGRWLLLLLLRLLWGWLRLLALLSLRFAAASFEPPLHELQRFPAPSRSARHDFWLALE